MTRKIEQVILWRGPGWYGHVLKMESNRADRRQYAEWHLTTAEGERGLGNPHLFTEPDPGMTIRDLTRG